MTMVMLALMDVAVAGNLFYIDAGEAYAQALDTRSLSVVDFAPLTDLGYFVAGLAFDGSQAFWAHGVQGGWQGLIYLDPPYTVVVDWEWIYGPFNSV
jgi:hypothetical protein